MVDFETQRQRIFTQHAEAVLPRIDPDTGMIPGAGRASFGAHVHASGWEVRATAEAATALAMAGHEELAWKAIGRVLDYQDTNPASMTYGNFFWHSDWTKALDPNAVSFVIPQLAFVHRHRAARMPCELRQRLLTAFDLAYAGLNAHRATWGYTNIALLNLAAKTMVADALASDRIRDVAYWDWEEWRNHTARLGAIPEFNSVCYTTVQIHALAMLLAGDVGERFRREVRAAMRHLIAEAVLDFHPVVGRITGPQSRAYERDRRLRGASGMDTVLHFVLGTPAPAHGCMMWLGAPIGPEDVRPEAVNPPLPRTTSSSCHGFTRTNHLAAEFALGSVSGRRHLCGITVPFFVAFRSQDPRCTVAFIEDAKNPGDAYFSTQAEGSVLGGCTWLLETAPGAVADKHWWEGALSGLNTGRPGNTAVDPAFRPGFTVELGQPGLVRLFGPDGAVRPAESGAWPGATLLLETESVRVGLRFRGAGRSPVQLRLVLLPDGELVLDVRGSRTGTVVSEVETATLCAFALDVIPRSVSIDSAECARRLATSPLRLRRAGAGWTVAARAWDGAPLKVTAPAQPGWLYACDDRRVTPNVWVQTMR